MVSQKVPFGTLRANGGSRANLHPFMLSVLKYRFVAFETFLRDDQAKLLQLTITKASFLQPIY